MCLFQKRGAGEVSRVTWLLLMFKSYCANKRQPMMYCFHVLFLNLVCSPWS
eukprot:m.13477 g.13477  ORF g.13477 m.13477 type:complete len:51 (+) comp4574_c0_seq2:129-281(+)